MTTRITLVVEGQRLGQRPSRLRHARGALSLTHCPDPVAALNQEPMAALRSMPPISVPQIDLALFGQRWTANGGALKRSRPESSMELGKFFDGLVASSLATMLGGIRVEAPNRTALTPPIPDCLETGDVRIIGGVRPQNFDIGYRPDGVRIAYDSKTLNDSKSVRKNYQNMINDLATEATTVHSRFPYSLVVFLVAIPAPCLGGAIESALTLTLERLAQRELSGDAAHLAEAATLIVWDPASGTILPERPAASSNLRIENCISASSGYIVTGTRAFHPMSRPPKRKRRSPANEGDGHIPKTSWRLLHAARHQRLSGALGGSTRK